MTDKNKKVRYIDKVDTLSTGELYPYYKYKTVSNDKSFRYHNTLAHLLRLSAKAHNLLYYLIDYMDKDNFVYSNNRFKTRFNNLIFTASKEKHLEEGASEEEAIKLANAEKYSDVSIRKAFSELKKYNLILTSKRADGSIARGEYVVNPEFFWKGQEKDRDERIRRILQIECGSSKTLIKVKK